MPVGKPGRPWLAMANVGLFYRYGTSKHVVPDVMVSLDVVEQALPPGKDMTYSLHYHGKPPELVVEIISNTKGREAVEKMQIYAEIGVQYYLLFDPENYLRRGPLQVYTLNAGTYQQVPMTDGMYWLERLGFGG